MDHGDALREMSVERYLLGELTGESRDLFEEHMFECDLCALDVKSGVTLLEGVRAEEVPGLVSNPTRRKVAHRFQWLLSPAWMVPALAACLMLIMYQTFVVVPGMRRQVAQVETPAVLNNLVLAGGVARGAKTLRIMAPENGSFLLSVDIPALAMYSSYRCALYSPLGVLVWHGDVSSEQAKDTVQIHVPAAITRAGENTLRIQGIRQNDASGAKLVDLATHTFVLELHK